MGSSSKKISQAELEVLIQHNSWCAVGRMFDVSDNAVRKWAKSYGIPTKKERSCSVGGNNLCLNCGCATSNPKYCSTSCNAVDRNKRIEPKEERKLRQPKIAAIDLSKYTTKGTVRKRKRGGDTFCVLCTTSIPSGRKCCRECREQKALRLKSVTVAEVVNRLALRGKHKSWKNSVITMSCRTWNKVMTKQPCRHCNYAYHVELCHLKPIRDFPDTTTLGEINHPDNVMPLCPNCHWEFDHGLWEITDL